MKHQRQLDYILIILFSLNVLVHAHFKRIRDTLRKRIMKDICNVLIVFYFIFLFIFTWTLLSYYYLYYFKVIFTSKLFLICLSLENQKAYQFHLDKMQRREKPSEYFKRILDNYSLWSFLLLYVERKGNKKKLFQRKSGWHEQRN